MRTYCEELRVHYPSQKGFVNITADLRRVTRQSGIKEGLVLVNTMSKTASVFINNDAFGLIEDYKKWLQNLAACGSVNQHSQDTNWDDGTVTYTKSQAKGRDVVMSVTGGELDLGPGEEIYFRDFDGRRSELILVKIIGE